MKVTREIEDAFYDALKDSDCTVGDVHKALQAVLDSLPDVVPFAFKGYPDNSVYLHPTCGTVVDVSPDTGAGRAEVDRGECDCENTAPWLRIYVERAQ